MFEKFLPGQRDKFNDFYDSIKHREYTTASLQEFLFYNRKCENILEIVDKFTEIIEKNDPKNFEVVKEPKDSKSNFWLNAILTNNLNERNELLLHFSNNQIFARPAWTLLNKLPMFESSEKDELINSKWVADRLINIPSYPILK